MFKRYFTTDNVFKGAVICLLLFIYFKKELTFTITLQNQGSNVIETVSKTQVVNLSRELEVESEPVEDTCGKEVYAPLMYHLKNIEGIRLKPYKCAADYWTIGYGHLLEKGSWSKYKNGITLAHADSLLKIDFEKRYNQVRTAFPKLERIQALGIASLAFNIRGGVKSVIKNNIGTHLKNEDYEKAAESLLKYNKAWVDGEWKTLEGLEKRRLFERAFLLKDCDYIKEQSPIIRKIVIEKRYKEFSKYNKT
jgi:lysozyme